MGDTELMPCPRCGGEMALHENDWTDPPMWSGYCLAFETCGINMPERATKDEAVTAANFRRSEGGGWLPIDSADGKPCWIGHSPSGSMSPAYRDDRCLGVWRVWRTGKLISWMPTHWQPLPSPPAPSQEGASDTGEQVRSER